ncbi:hypothetical protein NO1_0393 [Candidatus Termititenax aidoneus]|uniref:Uncharacterized protein n=1 Tax=Termititenax aidoneus TaxID=2218524 RepID=A0A388T8I6_TERA1|nr:hypothetical protein NO1_0393 [Candidatus Termititenax aidoneus]
MADPYIPNITQVPNFVVNREKPDMTKTIIIENPQLELDILRKFAALKKDAGGNYISTDDYKANQQQADELLGQMQGIYMYWNDNCPLHEALCTFYDLETARLFLEGLRERLGAAKFANSYVVMEEFLFGLDFRKIPQFAGVYFPPEEPPHHAIVRAYNVPKEGSFTVNPPMSSLSRPTKEILFNLQLYNPNNVLLSRLIKQPDRELRLLREIAALDKDETSISDADLRHSAYQQKLRQLEGYRLYTNDPGEDATQTDLNCAYALLDAMGAQYNLSRINVLFSENIQPANDRRVIQNAQAILNEEPGFIEAANYAEKEQGVTK